MEDRRQAIDQPAAQVAPIARVSPWALAALLCSMVALCPAMTLLGPVLALTLRAEIGSITRFHRWPQLASYAGLVNAIDASAQRIRCGPITRRGSPWLRWALVEAAIHAMRRPDRTGRWARRLAGRISICPARVALARVLCRDVVRVWRTVDGE